MTAEERAFNYASTQKPTKLQVGEIAKHYDNGYQQALKDFMEKACTFLKNSTMAELCLDSELTELVEDFVEHFKNYMQDESEN